MMRNSFPCAGITRIRFKGFDLSLSFIPFGKGTPIVIGGKGKDFFDVCFKNQENNKRIRKPPPPRH